MSLPPKPPVAIDTASASSDSGSLITLSDGSPPINNNLSLESLSIAATATTTAQSRTSLYHHHLSWKPNLTTATSSSLSSSPVRRPVPPKLHPTHRQEQEQKQEQEHREDEQEEEQAEEIFGLSISEHPPVDDDGESGLDLVSDSSITPESPARNRRLSVRSKALLSHRSMVSRLSAPRSRPLVKPDFIPVDEVPAVVTQMFIEYYRLTFGVGCITPNIYAEIARMRQQVLQTLQLDASSSSADPAATISYNKVTDAVEELAEASAAPLKSPKAHQCFFDFGTRALNAAVSTTAGSRSVQEDTWQVIGGVTELFSISDGIPRAFLGIYDGHSGSQASTFARTHMHAEIAQALSSLHPQPPTSEMTVEAIRQAYLAVDRKFCRFARRADNDAGSTAVTVLIENGRRAFVSHLGDSCAVIFADGVPALVSPPHKPNRPDEEERIKAHGGCVVWWGSWRINGVLAVSRSIGDLKLKETGVVSAEPETFVVDLESDPRFCECRSLWILAASDGLWDVFSIDDAADFVKRRCMRVGSDSSNSNADSDADADAEELTDELVQEALGRGTKDNVTLGLVRMR